MPSARSEAIEALAGEPLLRMVHTRDGAWAANAVLRYGSAKDCKKFVKAMKGACLPDKLEINRWGALQPRPGLPLIPGPINAVFQDN